jgi:hypothetical protein
MGIWHFMTMTHLPSNKNLLHLDDHPTKALFLAKKTRNSSLGLCFRLLAFKNMLVLVLCRRIPQVPRLPAVRGILGRCRLRKFPVPLPGPSFRVHHWSPGTLWRLALTKQFLFGQGSAALCCPISQTWYHAKPCELCRTANHVSPPKLMSILCL